ncbi:hypothetical protein [Sphingosinicella sp. BN140058]|uniref:hypothetical protein n=1 Tax=Sphingosinicella sp. BN140058 TaxID=1892855 RepID=UPI0013EE09D8|nr:hypothetical protein [Sphingosinicella sp. BN140058]
MLPSNLVAAFLATPRATDDGTIEDWTTRMNQITENELADVRRLVAEGRSVPAVIVGALLARMDRAERMLARR